MLTDDEYNAIQPGEILKFDNGVTQWGYARVPDGWAGVTGTDKGRRWTFDDLRTHATEPSPWRVTVEPVAPTQAEVDAAIRSIRGVTRGTLA